MRILIGLLRLAVVVSVLLNLAAWVVPVVVSAVAPLERGLVVINDTEASGGMRIASIFVQREVCVAPDTVVVICFGCIGRGGSVDIHSNLLQNRHQEVKVVFRHRGAADGAEEGVTPTMIF
ncbi:hypothetical protein DFH09DRAFT_1145214 [Mycena vulgaris]|nr:hypothetical protein DFH09DRAFT_1145214 [Mycena vulgaris]